MIAVLFLGNRFCKGINEEADLRMQRLELEHKSRFIDSLENGTISEIPAFDPTN
jgi:hypothetical protein